MLTVGLDASSLLRRQRFGISHHGFEIVTGIARLGRDVRFALFYDREIEHASTFDDALINELGDVALASPIKTVGPTPELAYLAWWRWHLPRAVARRNVDVFYGFSQAIPYTRRCRQVLTVHDLMPVDYLSWTTGDQRARKVRSHLNDSMTRADSLIAVSGATKSDIRLLDESLARRTTVIPNAVRESLIEAPDAETLSRTARELDLPERFLLTVGADTPRRNYATMLKALTPLWMDGRLDVPLLMVGGRDWHESRIYETVTTTSAREHVLFRSGVDDEQLASVYRLASLYVCPSLFEGFGMPVSEALSCGTPVTCSDLPALREVGGEDVAYFMPHDPHEMGIAVLRGCRDDELRRRALSSPWHVGTCPSWAEVAASTFAVLGAS